MVEFKEEGLQSFFFLFFFFSWLPLLCFCKARVLWFVAPVMSDITFTAGSLLPRGSKNRATGSLRYGKPATVPRM